MKNIYSILTGTFMVAGLFFLVKTIFFNNNSITTNLFIVILIAGGYLVTYKSNNVKTRNAIFAGFSVGMILIIYQLLTNRSMVDILSVVGYLLLPGFFMMIGGFAAKISKKQMDELIDHLSRKDDGESRNIGK